jgi:hypothetical protein
MAVCDKCHLQGQGGTQNRAFESMGTRTVVCTPFFLYLLLLFIILSLTEHILINELYCK